MKMKRLATAFALALGVVSGGAMAAETGGFANIDLGLPTYGLGGNQPVAVRAGGGANFVTLIDDTLSIGVEGDLVNFGEASYAVFGSSTKVKTWGIQVGAVVGWDIPHVKGLGVIGRAGIMHSTSTVTNNVGGFQTSFGSTANNLYYGAGIKYSVAKNIDVRAMYENFGSPAATGTGINYSLEMYSAGVVFRF